MKKTIGKILFAGSLVAVSSGIGALTAYQLNKGEKNIESVSSPFVMDGNVKYAGMSSSSLQPVDLTTAADQSVHAVVHIRSKKMARDNGLSGGQNDIFEFFFGQPGMRKMQERPIIGFGSGVIISKDGYIVTNNHVVGGADEIKVKLNDGREYSGSIVGTDPDTDLALIKINGEDLPILPIGNSDELKVGEWVLAVGNPFNLNSTVTAGIVSAKARTIGAEAANGKGAKIQSFIQTDAAINQGNSGGALVNVKGELVGVNAMLYSPTGAYSGYGFAIPTSIMVKVVSDLKQFGAVQRVLLGIRGGSLGTDLHMDDEMAKGMKEKLKNLGVKDGVIVAEVVSGGSASGILEKDDVITSLDGEEVHDFGDLQQILAKKRPGDKVKVEIVRDKKRKTLEMVLKNAQGTTKVVREKGMDILGAAFKPITREIQETLRLPYGLIVTGVTDGKMKEAGVRKNFIIVKVNGKPVRSVDELKYLLREAENTPEQVLFMSGIYPSGNRANYAVELSETK